MPNKEESLEEILGLAKSEQFDLPSDSQVKELSGLCQELSQLRGRITKGEELLEVLKKEELRLSTEVIPSKMDEVGFTKMVLPDGRSVSWKPFYSGKILPEREPEAFDWLENNGHGGVIKGEAIIPYRRQERDEVLALVELIREKYHRDVNIKLGVHHSTLRSLIREVVEEGETFPPELFNIFIGRKTELK